MVDLQIGRHGAVVLLVVFLILAVEDVLIWLERGAVPGIEFFAASLVVLLVLAYVIRASRRHEPSGE